MKNKILVIIPAYNAHDTIVKTLSSIKLQTISDLVTVYIVDDCSKKGYKKEIDFFKNDLKIVELRTPYNMGPGKARQFALDNTNGTYVMFIDADDQLYNAYVLNLLYYEIDTNELDAVNSSEILSNGEILKLNNSLHGKLYRRSFLIENNIRFSNTRYSEDNSFTKIVFNVSNRTKFIDIISYVYFINENSITNKNYFKNRENIVKYFMLNMVYTVLELKKRNVSDCDSKIADFLLPGYIYVFSKVYFEGEENFKNLYKYCFRYEELFREYEHMYSLYDFIRHISNMFYCSDRVSEKILVEFNSFRNKFLVNYGR